ncbi:MAG: hypothetical protein ACI32F_07550 [Allobaculum sp.]
MSQDVLVILNSSRFGQGNPQLGERLMKTFLSSLATGKTRPTAILLYNSAVVLASSESPVLEDLQTLEKEGIEILVNEESLSFYSLDAALKAGTSCPLADMSEKMMNADLIVKP